MDSVISRTKAYDDLSMVWKFFKPIFTSFQQEVNKHYPREQHGLYDLYFEFFVGDKEKRYRVHVSNLNGQFCCIFCRRSKWIFWSKWVCLPPNVDLVNQQKGVFYSNTGSTLIRHMNWQEIAYLYHNRDEVDGKIKAKAEELQNKEEHGHSPLELYSN
jgi:hypothetical protein